MKLSKQQKIDILKHAREKCKKHDKYNICGAFVSYVVLNYTLTEQNTVINSIRQQVLPLLEKEKPTSAESIWWPLNEEGQKQMLKAIDNTIERVKNQE